MNEIVELCEGYKRLSDLDPLFELLQPYYHMEKTKPLLCATPWKMVQKVKSNTAVLLIHGFQGYPGEMDYLGLKLYQSNFDVYCPRLPGHGVNAQDFLNTNKDDWLSVARTSVGYLKKEYDNVFVVGHSMGGLIATIVAKEFNLERLGLISPAFIIKGFSKFKVNLINLFKKEIEIDWHSDSSFWGICERDEKDDITLGKTYWSKLRPRPLLELNKLKEMGTRSLSKITSKTICILGEKDPSVDSIKVESLLKSKISSPLEIITIEGVNHLCQYFNEEDKRDYCNDSIVKSFTDLG
ncbi:MAG: alpha/beta fold hydrolase [Sphaerochaetaceae bacterium]|nr:alpha/beta fold hydrolase [Sphaerochaetaceae bacterium]